MSSAPPVGYPPTDRTVPTRSRERAAYDREVVHAILDEGYVCHLGFVRDGAPVVLPTLYARHGERLYVHGSTGSRPLRGARDDGGLAVCLTVTHVDGLVLARSAFHHSVNYRSVVVHGTAVIRLDLLEVSAKIRTGGPNDEPEDLTLPHWTGVVPVARTYGTPVPADDLDPSIPLPDYLMPGHPAGR
jgi:nitroimidazol reductase NimA-like FMN-containing flavoprotein (pyridoxamine 5'-phosphate oxidase superfamily)